VGVAFPVYTQSAVLFDSLLQSGVAQALALPPANVQVTGAQAAGSGTEVSLYLLAPTVVEQAASSSALATLLTPGAALSALLASLSLQGLPLSALSLGCAPPRPPSPPLADLVAAPPGTFRLALDIPYGSLYATLPGANAAVQSAVAQVLGLPSSTVQVLEYLPAARISSSVLVLALLHPAGDYVQGLSTDAGNVTHSARAAAEAVSFRALFEANGFNALPASGAPASGALLYALASFGLSVNAAYFNDTAAA
jgi:hypothetical protein